MTTDRRFPTLATRLAAAFVAVAVLAVGVLATMVIVAASRQTDSLMQHQHRSIATSVAGAVAHAYEAAGGWQRADLSSAAAIAAGAEAHLAVSDSSGRTVADATQQLNRMLTDMHGISVAEEPVGRTVTAPVITGGKAVGKVTLRFPKSHDAPTEQVRTALFRTAVAGAAIAAGIALVAAVWFASRLTRPVVALTDAAQRLADGDRTARADSSGPGELGTLAAAFDEMADRLEAEDQLRRQLVADVAHELRTPIAVLQAQTEALIDGVVAPDDDVLESLRDEALRLAHLVGDLETLAAADAARLRLDERDIDLSDVAARAVASVRATAEGRGVDVRTALSAAPTHGDANRLVQVVVNLLSNAVKFTPEAGTVDVTTGLADGHAFVRVDDTGPGLGAGDENHLFERFWQGSAGKAAATGSGIGLAVASRIADAHHATLLAVNRADGPGASFSLTMPANPT